MDKARAEEFELRASELAQKASAFLSLLFIFHLSLVFGFFLLSLAPLMKYAAFEDHSRPHHLASFN